MGGLACGQYLPAHRHSGHYLQHLALCLPILYTIGCMPVRQTHCLLCTRHTIYLIWATFLYARNYNFPRVFLEETFTFLVENNFLVKTLTFLVETFIFL